ncbi:efflux transporter outer membrane subunit [Magnetospirillum sp. UT-4]|uniref:efflux transporter outer membrane subunit n=1 Tax=Magnetospirillum sp. UT-4 TaxID=2681467 RepID=UPI00157294A4|nr:efflux transporter outer membrane subunit [Magnetospirillum sp. UT-4]
MPVLARGAHAALLCTFAASCTVGPDYVRPQTPLPGTYRAGANDMALHSPPTRWWTQFQSPELDALIEDALTNNQDVRAAIHRIAQAEARAGIEAGTLLPQLKASAQADASAPKGGIGSTTTTSERSGRTFQVGLQASYEIDLWGKNKSAMEAALATAQASAFDRETVAMTLVADVATTYFTFLQFCDRVVVYNNNVQNMSRVMDKVKRRRDLGEGSDLEVAQQAAIMAQAEATRAILQLGREQQFNRLAVLLGRAPGEFALSCKPLAGLAIPDIRPGIPSELLLRRPDVRKAESDLVSANANINMARAKLFPSLELTGERGYGSSALLNVLSPASLYWSIGASLAQTLFDNGKTDAEIAYYEARFAELVETYRKTIFSSLRDVEDALATVHYAHDRNVSSTERVKFAREARRLSERSFTIGVIDYLTVLDTERTLYDAEDLEVQARLSRLTAAVSLYKALGGGLEDEDIPPRAAAQPAPASDGAKENSDAKG